MLLWMIASVLNAYTFYFDLPAAVTILTVSLEYLSIFIGIYNFNLWLWLTASRQGLKWVDITLFSIDEYTCLVHSLSLFIYALSTASWHLNYSDTDWKNRKEDSLIFDMITYYLVLVVVTSKGVFTE